MNENIFLIDDNPDLFLIQILTEEKFNIRSFESADDFFLNISIDKPDLIVLDLVMPGKSGVEIFRDLIKFFSDIPVIIVSGKDSSDIKTFCLELGAVDYVTKPIDYNNFIARIKTHLRKFNQLKEKISTITNPKDFTFNSDNRSVEFQDKIIHLTNIEYQLLKYFLEKRGQIVKKEDLIKKIYDEKEYVSKRTIEQHICHLRRKVKNKFDEQIKIITVFKDGYKLKM